MGHRLCAISVLGNFRLPPCTGIDNEHTLAKCERSPSTSHAARTYLSHQRAPMRSFGQLVKFDHVDYRCLPSTAHYWHRFAKFARVLGEFLCARENAIVCLLLIQIVVSDYKNSYSPKLDVAHPSTPPPLPDISRVTSITAAHRVR